MKSKEFNQLKKEWDSILKKEGLRDFGDFPSSEVIEPDPVKMFYFDKCMEYCHSGKFKDELDRFIFEKHAEGLSIREIETTLINENHKPIKKDAIVDRITKILKEAGIQPIEIRR